SPFLTCLLSSPHFCGLGGASGASRLGNTLRVCSFSPNWRIDCGSVSAAMGLPTERGRWSEPADSLHPQAIQCAPNSNSVPASICSDAVPHPKSIEENAFTHGRPLGGK